MLRYLTSRYIAVYVVGVIADKDSANEREKLQKDLQNTKSALEDIKKEEASTVSNQESASSPRISGDEQVCIKLM